MTCSKRRWIHILTIALALVIILLIYQAGKQGAIGWSYQKCINCEEFNRHSELRCTQDIHECGPCLPGCTPDISDDRVCTVIEIWTNPPEIASSESESDLRLACVFTAKVTCAWEHDGQAVSIGGKSRYQFGHEGVNTSTTDYVSNDCSLTIKQLSWVDVGHWQCISNDSSNATYSLRSTMVKVSIKIEPELEKPSKNSPIIYLNGGIVNKQPIPSSSLKQSKPSAHLPNPLFNCTVNVTSKRLQWEIQGQRIVSENNVNYLALESVKVQKYMTKKYKYARPTYLTLLCVAEYDDEIAMAYVALINEGPGSSSSHIKQHESSLLFYLSSLILIVISNKSIL